MDYKKRFDNETGQIFYENIISGETSVEKPVGNPLESAFGDFEKQKNNNQLVSLDVTAVEDDLKLCDPGDYDNSRDQMVEILAPGWIEKYDDIGTAYYLHVETGEQSMKKPILQLQVPDLSDDEDEEQAKILSIREIRKQTSECLLDLVRSVIAIDKTMKKEAKRLKHVKNYQQALDAAYQTALKTVPLSLPEVAPDLLRRQRRRLEAARFKHRGPKETNFLQQKKKLEAEREEKLKKKFQHLTNVVDNIEQLDLKAEEELERLEARFKKRYQHQQAKIARRELKRKILLRVQLRSSLTKKMMPKIAAGCDLSQVQFNPEEDPRLAPGYQLTPEEYEELNQERREKKERRRKISQVARKVFDLVDTLRTGDILAQDILNAMQSNEKVLKLLILCPPLQHMAVNVEYHEEFKLIDVDGNGLVSMSEFLDFVLVVTDVLDHLDKLSKAIEAHKAKLEEIELKEFTSKIKQVAKKSQNKQEMEKDNERETVLDQKRTILSTQVRSRRTSLSMAQLGKNPRVMASHKKSIPSWQQHHYHRLIRLRPDSVLYCCVCRKRQWEVAKLHRDEAEHEFRSIWEKQLARTLRDANLEIKKNIRLKSIRAFSKAQNQIQKQMVRAAVPVTLVKPRRSFLARFAARFRRRESDAMIREQVSQLLKEMVAKIEVEGMESVMNEKVKRKRQRKIERKALKEVLAMKQQLERIECERNSMYDEDERERMRIEYIKRQIERPLKLEQEKGHRNYLNLIGKCQAPSPVLSRLQWERTLVHGHYQMVIQAYDRAVSKRYIVQTIECGTTERAKKVYETAKAYQRNKNPYLVTIFHVFQYSLLSFGSNGSIVENVPILICIHEYCSGGQFEQRLAKHPHPITEADICTLLRQLSAPLAALHSQKLIHGNLKLSNIYFTRIGQLKIGGYLLFKDSRALETMSKITSGGFAPEICAPEVELLHQEASTKVDIWALGCIAYQLVTATASSSLVHLPLKMLLRKIPFRFTALTYSILRMTLQENPEFRCTANELFNYISLSSSLSDKSILSDAGRNHPKQVLHRAKQNLMLKRALQRREETLAEDDPSSSSSDSDQDQRS